MAVSDLINSIVSLRCNVDLTASSFSEMHSDDFPWRMTHAPIVSVTSITNVRTGQTLSCGPAISASSTDTYYNDDASSQFPQDGRIHATGNTAIGSGPWLVEYEAGYSTLPVGLAEVIHEMTDEAEAIDNMPGNAGMFSTESKDAYSRTMMNKEIHELYHQHEQGLQLWVRF